MDAQNENKDFLVERAFVALVVELIESEKLPIKTHREFAWKAFPQKGERLWKAIRIGTPTTNKPQEVSIEHALAIARTVGKPLLSLIARAQYMVEEENWTLDQDPFNNRSPKGRQRKKGVADTIDQNSTVTP